MDEAKLAFLKISLAYFSKLCIYYNELIILMTTIENFSFSIESWVAFIKDTSRKKIVDFSAEPICQMMTTQYMQEVDKTLDSFENEYQSFLRRHYFKPIGQFLDRSNVWLAGMIHMLNNCSPIFRSCVSESPSPIFDKTTDASVVPVIDGTFTVPVSSTMVETTIAYRSVFPNIEVKQKYLFIDISAFLGTSIPSVEMFQAVDDRTLRTLNMTGDVDKVFEFTLDSAYKYMVSLLSESGKKQLNKTVRHRGNEYAFVAFENYKVGLLLDNRHYTFDPNLVGLENPDPSNDKLNNYNVFMKVSFSNHFESELSLFTDRIALAFRYVLMTENFPSTVILANKPPHMFATAITDTIDTVLESLKVVRVKMREFKRLSTTIPITDVVASRYFAPIYEFMVPGIIYFFTKSMNNAFEWRDLTTLALISCYKKADWTKKNALELLDLTRNYPLLGTALDPMYGQMRWFLGVKNKQRRMVVAFSQLIKETVIGIA